MKRTTLRLFLGVAAISAGAAFSQSAFDPMEISEDSEMVLEMEGAVKAKIRIATVEGSSSISVERNGESDTLSMSEVDCRELWDYCLKRDAATLPSMRASKNYPDSSTFALSFRVGSDTRRFTVRGVDQLQDTRYREIVRKILAVASKYVTDLEG